MRFAEKQLTQPMQTPQSNGVALHRKPNHRASLMRAAPPLAQSAWQSRNAPKTPQHPLRDTPVVNVVDMIVDPLRWMTATKPRRIASIALLGMIALTVVF